MGIHDTSSSRLGFSCIACDELVEITNLSRNQQFCDNCLAGIAEAGRKYKQKCDGCKRAEGTDSIYTCNCNVK